MNEPKRRAKWYAKQAGKTKWGVFDPDIDMPLRTVDTEAEAEEIAKLANELEEALEAHDA